MKNIYLSIGVLILLGAGFYFFSSSHNKKEVSSYVTSSIEVKTFQTDETNGGWGYDVFIDGNLYVHQPTIPAVGGNAGFKTEINAQKTGELVITKIRNNILPPTVSPEELKNVGVL